MHRTRCFSYAWQGSNLGLDSQLPDRYRSEHLSESLGRDPVCLGCHKMQRDINTSQLKGMSDITIFYSDTTMKEQC